MVSKIQINILCAWLSAVLIACSSSIDDPFEDISKKHRARSIHHSEVASTVESKNGFVNPVYTYDTFFLKVHKSEYERTYYMAAELIHKGIHIYRVLLIWEIDFVLYLLIETRPYGKNSWKYISWLTYSPSAGSLFYARPLNGEEFKNVKSRIFEKNPSKKVKKQKRHGKKK